MSSAAALPAPQACGNAEQYVRRRLRSADEPLAPADLADEYDCASGYMRDVLSELVDAGAVERVGRGRYVDADGALTPSGSSGTTDVSEQIGPGPSDQTGQTEAGSDEESDQVGGESDDSPGGGRDDQTGQTGPEPDEESGQMMVSAVGPSDEESDQNVSDPSDSTSDSTSSQGVESVGTAPAAAAATGAVGATAAAANEDGVDGRVVVAGLAVLVVGYLLYRRATESGGGQDESSSSPSAEQSEQTQMAGGLAQGGA